MRTLLPVLLFLVTGSFASHAQTYIPLADNTSIESNTDIKILGGDYSITDSGNDGILQINNAENVVIDGDSVMVNGNTYAGYLIKITNSNNVVIKNFVSANHFKYAAYITGSTNIEIYNCDFSYNKVDSSGWIDVWAGYTSALGGGVLFYNCDSVSVHDNIMKLQNDGVALYNSAHAEVYNNHFEWNTSFGIRMYFTDSSSIHDNIANHINRPYTDPSDCAAILLIVSNENNVQHNDFSYSGDGIFLGQYNYSDIPNNNYFAYNECSGSPHNAIEATFADGNIYKHNLCNSSHYGLWLGYSFNSIVDSNEINYNHHSGIAIDRGFNNVITNNSLLVNPIGVELWEGSPIAGYEDQYSQDYTISTNMFEGNTTAISAGATENMSVTANSFIKNYSGIELSGTSGNELLEYNYFDPSVIYDVKNTTTYDVNAPNQTFRFCDSSFLEKKIYDDHDNASYGEVLTTPYACDVIPEYQTQIPEELSEPPSLWYSYPEACWWRGIVMPITVSFDTVTKHDGTASVHLSTGTGWFNGLHYFPAGDSITSWNLSNYQYLNFWIYSIDTNLGAFQYFHVRVGNASGGFYKYTSSGAVLNQSLNTWKNYVVPLAGGPGWTKSTTGTVSLSDINYVEIYTDSYGVGYELWLDGVKFTGFTNVPASEPESNGTAVFPNPFTDRTTLQYSTCRQGPITFELIDAKGQTARRITRVLVCGGDHELVIEKGDLTPGIYFFRLKTNDATENGKVVVQ